MGRHASRWRWLPSQIKPQYRFPLAVAGILLLAFATLGVAASVFPKTPEAAAGPTPLDETTVVEPTVPSAGPASGQLIAYYVVPLTAVSATGFQAEVLITNAATTPQGWQVMLAYAPSVTGYVSTKVDGAPQPKVDIDRPRFTFTGTAPVAPGQTVQLRIQFTAQAPSDIEPIECTVNGSPCNRP